MGSARAAGWSGAALRQRFHQRSTGFHEGSTRFCEGCGGSGRAPEAKALRGFRQCLQSLEGFLDPPQFHVYRNSKIAPGTVGCTLTAKATKQKRRCAMIGGLDWWLAGRRFCLGPLCLYQGTADGARPDGAIGARPTVGPEHRKRAPHAVWGWGW